MGIRDNAKELFSQHPDYQALTPEEQNTFLDKFTASRRSMSDFLGSMPDYQALEDEERVAVLSKLAPEYYAVEPRPLSLNIPERAQDKLAIEDPWDKPISATVKRTVGSLANKAAGAMQLGADFTASLVSDTDLAMMGVPEEQFKEKRAELAQKSAFGIHAIAQNMESTIAYLKGASKDLYKDSVEYSDSLTSGKKWVFENAQFLIEALPTIAGLLYGGAPTAIAMAASQAGAQKYGEARDAGYSPVTALPQAAVAAGTVGAFAGVNSYFALQTLAKPALRRLMAGMIIDSGTDYLAPVIDFAADFLTDNLLKTSEESMNTGETLYDAHNRGLMNVAYSVGSNFLFNAAPLIARKTVLWADGMKETQTKDGQTIVHPIELADDVDSIVAMTDFTGRDAHAEVSQMILATAATQAKNNRISRIELDQKNRPLNEVDLEAQGPATRKTDNWSVNQDVGISPEFFKSRDNKPRNLEVPAKLVKLPYDVVTTEVDAGGFPIDKVKSYVDVDLPGEGPTTIPVEFITNTARLEGGAIPMESARLTDAFSQAFYPDLPVEDWTHAHARLATGGLFGIAPVLPQGALGTAKKTSLGMIYDAMRNNPSLAPRIMTHEIGHLVYNLKSDTLAKMNIPDFQGFKEFILERTRKTDKATVQEFKDYRKQLPPELRGSATLEKFVLEKFYGPELNDLWNRWSTYKSEIPEAGELMANALSVYLNDQMGGKGLAGFRGMQVYKDFGEWVTNNPKLNEAMDNLRSNVFDTPGSVLRRDTESQVTADKIIARSRQGDDDGKPSLLDNMVNRFDTFLKTVKNDPKAIDQTDKFFMVGGLNAHFIEKTVIDTFRTLDRAGVRKEHYGEFLKYRRILSGDRTKAISRLKLDSKYDNMPEFQHTLKLEATRLQDEAQDANPNWSPKQVEDYVQAGLKKAIDDNTITEMVDLLNPGGRDRTTALQGMAELVRTYGWDKLGIMDDRRQAEHKAFVDLVLPVLRESKFFTEAQLNKMENNEDYATFSIAHHALKAKRARTTGGTPDYFYESMGTLAASANPHTAMAELRSKMLLGVTKAALTRDMMDLLAQYEDKYPDKKKAYRVSNGTTEDKLPDKTYKLFKSREYNPTLRKMEDKTWAVKENYLDIFTKASETSSLIGAFSSVQGQMKSWMTIYNPRFWMKNFVRDVIRTSINAPGVLAPFSIVKETLAAGGKDLYLKARGRENPERETMIRERLVGDVRSHAQVGDVMPTEHVIGMAGYDPATFGKTWKDIHGAFDTMKYLAGKASEPWKRFTAFFGDSVEFSTKAAMKRYLDKNYSETMTKAERDWYVRNVAGTPMIAKSGHWNKILGNALMFYNPNVQGTVGDLAAWNRDRVANTIKRMAVIAPYVMVVQSMLMGEYGEEYRQWAENISTQQHSRGWNIPMGFTANGDSAMMQLPLDQTDSMLMGMAFRTADKLREGTFGPTDLGAAFFQSVDESIPSISPIAQLGLDAAHYATAKPTDKDHGNVRNYAGQWAINPRVAAGDDWVMKGAYMGLHAMGLGFGGPLNAFGITPLARGVLDARIPRANKAEEAQTDAQKMNTQIQSWVGNPLGYVLGGLFKFTSAGINERADAEAQLLEAKINDNKYAVDKALQRVLVDPTEKLTEEEMAQMAQPEHEQQVKETLQRVMVDRGLAKAGLSELQAIFTQLEYNPSKPKRIALLKMAWKRMQNRITK